MIEHELPSRDEIVAMLENAGLQLSAYCRFESGQTGAGLDHDAAHGFRASTLISGRGRPNTSTAMPNSKVHRPL
jgi:hypothetical protein